MPLLPSYRNQSIGWFLYEGNLSILWFTQTKYLMERIVSAAAQSFHLNLKGKTNFSNILALSWIMAFKMVRHTLKILYKLLQVFKAYLTVLRHYALRYTLHREDTHIYFYCSKKDIMTLIWRSLLA